jgi:hypothetical protein
VGLRVPSTNNAGGRTEMPYTCVPEKRPSLLACDLSPLTDEELQDIHDFADSDARHRLLPHWKVLTNPTSVRRVAAELRRLRADGWLVAAAEEIAVSANPYDWQANLAILRKRRDGKA